MIAGLPRSNESLRPHWQWSFFIFLQEMGVYMVIGESSKRMDKMGAMGTKESMLQAPIHQEGLRQWLQELLDQGEFIHLFQPIMDIHRQKLFGYEALLRVDERHNLSPHDLFSIAKAMGMSYELDMASLKGAIRTFASFSGYLFLNVLPSTLLHADFYRDFQSVLSAAGVSGERIMLEITEGEMVDNYTRMRDCLDRLKRLGVSIALDDVGSGYSIQTLTELESDLIKIDRFLVEDVDESDKKQRMIKLIRELLDERVLIVAEGIEKARELETLQKLGIQLGQGYFLGRPSPLKMP
jgi:EAL domain-containing protein (putative c-di-GMP-specific phosphodiesterase class I)